GGRALGKRAARFRGPAPGRLQDPAQGAVPPRDPPRRHRKAPAHRARRQAGPGLRGVIRTGLRWAWTVQTSAGRSPWIDFGNFLNHAPAPVLRVSLDLSHEP